METIGAANPRPGYGRIIDANPPMPVHDRPVRRWFSFADIVTLAWHSRWLLLGGVVLGGAMGAGINEMMPPAFEASTVLLAHDADGDLQAEMSIARSDRVLRSAVQTVGAERIVTGLRMPEPLDRIWPVCPSRLRLRTDCAMSAVGARLQVGFDGMPGNTSSTQGAFLPLAQATGRAAGRALRLAVVAPNAALAMDLLNGVVDADRNARHDDYLTPNATKLLPDLDRVKQAMADDAVEANRIQGDANVLNIAQDIATTTAQASAIAERDSAIREQQSAVQVQLAKVAEAIPGIPERILDSHEESNADASKDARATLLQLQLERTHLATQYSRNYPGLIEVDRKIQATQAAIRAQSHNVSTTTKVIRNPAFDAMSTRLQSLQREAGALAQQHAELQRQQTILAARAGALRAANARLGDIRLRQETEAAVMRQMTMQMATLGSSDTLAAAQVDAMQVLVAPSITPIEGLGLGVRGAMGALIGLVFGGMAAVIAAKRRSVYVVGHEVERHLSLRELAQLAVWRRGKPLDVTTGMEFFATRMADDMDDRGAPLNVVHLVSTAKQDGAGLIAQAMASAFALSRSKRVLVFQLDRAGRWDIQSFGATTPASGPRSVQMQSIAAASPTPPPATAVAQGAAGDDASGDDAAVRVARALMGDSDAIGGQSRLQIARLRGMHDMILVVSAHDVAPAVTRSFSVLADLNVLVVRARMSKAYLAQRICTRLNAAGARTLGFVFTTETSFSSSRSVQCG